MLQNKTYQLSQKEFKVVFDSHYASLCIFANQYVPDMDIAKDVVQEVFVKVWEQKTPFQNEHSVKSFFYTAVRNKSLDYLRSKYHRVNASTDLKELEKVETEAYFLREVVFVEVNTLLNEAISTLPKRCALVMQLSMKEYSNKTIAEQLNISVKTVVAQKGIAYKKLRPLMDGYLSLIAFLLLK